MDSHVMTKITFTLIALKYNVHIISRENTSDQSLQAINESYDKGLFETAIEYRIVKMDPKYEDAINSKPSKLNELYNLRSLQAVNESYDKGLFETAIVYKIIKEDPKYEDVIDSKRSILNKLYHLRKGP